MGTPESQLDESEFCTECGNFVVELNEATGWCFDCSKELGYIVPSCPHCGEESINGKLCSRCKYVRWLERNADAIESVMAIQCVTASAAKRIVRESNRPICNSCGNPIKGGQKDKHYFCRKNPECVKAHTAYSYHIRNKPHDEALQLAITASLIYKLTANITK